jgi:RNA polymerase sigma factor (sigma-70 family)
MESDAALLERFARTGDEDAFGQMVERHAPMMRGVVMRATGDAALADEVTQTVFAILARKAGALGHEAVAGWLHRTTLLEARNASRKAARYRRVLEKFRDDAEAAERRDVPGVVGVLPQLDLAMSRLNEEERELVVRRYFEGESVREIAMAKGTSEEACKKRLQRTVQRLGAVLRGRGMRTSAGSVAAVLTAEGLGVRPASASELAAGALREAARVEGGGRGGSVVGIWGGSMGLKVAVAAVLMAAIPVGVLWRENGELRRELEVRRAGAVPMGGREGTGGGAVEERRPTGLTAAVFRGNRAGVGGTAAGGGLDAVMTREMILEVIDGQAELRVERMFSRFCATVSGLTDGQKARLREEIEGRIRVQTEVMREVVEGALARGSLDPASFSQEERDRLAAAEGTELEVDDAALRGILTEEQFGRFAAVREMRRVAAAEESGNEAVRAADRYVDLTAEQRDLLFQRAAAARLGEGGAAEAGKDASGAAEEMLRSVLTPEQTEAYERARAQEERTVQRLLKLVPEPIR